MLVGYFGLTLLHTQKKGAAYELNLSTEVFFRSLTVSKIKLISLLS